MSKNKASISSAIDATNDSSPPLNFSFKLISGFQDIADEEPRQSSRRIEKSSETGKYKTSSLRLYNNTISDFEAFPKSLEDLIEDPKDLAWLDLSCNDIQQIDTVLLEYPNLKILYLHGNGIENLAEVDKLAGLPNLTGLTLHANPIEEKEDYKNYVLAVLPGLRSLDFYTITKQDRATAQMWKERFGTKFGTKFKRKAGKS